MKKIIKKTLTIGAITLMLGNYMATPTFINASENVDVVIRVGEYQNKSGKRLNNVPSDFDIDCPVRYENGVYSVREYDMNYKVAKEIVKYLKSKGVDVILQDTKGKSEDLNSAGRIAKKHDPEIYLAIHHNAYDENSSGYFIMYNEGDTQSKEYAKDINNALSSNPMLIPKKEIRANDGYIGELNQRPGDINLLAELGFFTNPEECKKCVDDKQVEFVAKTIGDQIIKILDETNNK